MRTESLPVPPIPDLAIVAEVIRLADAYEAERYAQRPPGYPTYRADDLDQIFRSRPKRDALFQRLHGLEDETVAALYSIYRLGDRPSSDASEAAERYRISFDLAMLPSHRPHGAADLLAKGPLADGLRRGLVQLGLWLESCPAGGSSDDGPTYSGRFSQ
jgi:hypothetical protein